MGFVLRGMDRDLLVVTLPTDTSNVHAFVRGRQRTMGLTAATPGRGSRLSATAAPRQADSLGGPALDR
jgi:hypothetical protein